MPEPLVCEGPDLDQLLQTVHSQPGAQVLYQDTVRRGGMLGFFAREIHRIAYQVPDAAAEIEASAAVESMSAVVESSSAQPLSDDPFAQLLASTDALEAAVNTSDIAVDDAAPDFAELLRRLSTIPDLSLDAVLADDALPAGPAVLTAETQSTASAPIADELPKWEPQPDEPQLALVTPLGRPDARGRLELLMQLRQVGVPVSVNPGSDAHSLYEALEDILQELPAPAVPPRQPGDILAIIGESAGAVRAAQTAASMLRIPDDAIGIAGLSREESGYLGYSFISGAREAARLRTELRLADTPSIVVIATDATTTDPDDPWVGEVLAALSPNSAWAVVDARWKTEDTRGYLDRIGGIDALVVHSAELSTSPATVWDLDLPLALLDGRAPTPFAWIGLLCRLLGSEARHRAIA
jgi:hypothetical protein